MVRAGLCRSQLVVGLRPDECLSFVGGVEVRVAMGAVEVLGHVMEATTDAETDAATPMHAPCWLGALTLHSVQPSTGPLHAIRMQCFVGGDLKRLITSIGRTAGVSAVVIFSEMSHTFNSVDCFWGSAPPASPAALPLHPHLPFRLLIRKLLLLRICAIVLYAHMVQTTKLQNSRRRI